MNSQITHFFYRQTLREKTSQNKTFEKSRLPCLNNSLFYPQTPRKIILKIKYLLSSFEKECAAMVAGLSMRAVCSACSSLT